MKKILASLLVLALCAPAMADVTVTAVGNGTDLEISIEVTGDSVVRGVALTLDSDGPKPTGASAVNSEFNAYIDAYWADDTILPALADETALPGTDDNGVLAAVGTQGLADLGTDVDVVLSAGVLDNSGAGGGLDATTGAVALATVSYDGAGNVCLSPDALRGGIVGDDLGTVTVQAACVTLSAGGPACWNTATQCKGDADGLYQGSDFTGYWYVGTDDLNILVAGWEVLEDCPTLTGGACEQWPSGPPTPSGDGIGTYDSPVVTFGGIWVGCADFDHDYQGSDFTGYWYVGTDDLNILVPNWEVLEDCPTLTGGACEQWPSGPPTPSGPGIAKDCI